jgi:DNA-binding response OmpR family regulator
MASASGQARGLELGTNRVALVVDDEDHILDTVQTWLSKIGWGFRRATSVSQALRAAKDPSLTLALIDFRLEEGTDGIRLGRALRRRLACRSFSSVAT